MIAVGFKPSRNASVRTHGDCLYDIPNRPAYFLHNPINIVLIKSRRMMEEYPHFCFNDALLRARSDSIVWVGIHLPDIKDTVHPIRFETEHNVPESLQPGRKIPVLRADINPLPRRI